MKKFTSGFILFLLSSFCNAQNGLENIIVEKYYISDANDSLASDGISINPGTLPVGSTTYRIYVDMLPGYNFQAAYGVPGHEFRIETSTLFYNNEDRGATSPTFTKAQAKNNTVMLDSWLTVGAACQGNYGVLKTADDGVATVVNADGVLQNNDPNAGIPISVEDGMIAGTPAQVTAVGITNEIAVFDAQNDGTNGPVFSSSNGSLACLGGATGPDTSTNQVLIAQITTNGTLCFELNIQIGTPGGGVQNFVARNPVGNEVVLNSLIYCSAVGIINPVSASGFSVGVFPNPAQDFVTLHITPEKNNSASSYAIFDVTGRLVKQRVIGQISGSYTEGIDISSFENGVYFIKVFSGGVSSTEKITKN
ncbi:MAG: T9SS type A sorting domain-containing protein [Bacteroidetes bacterium]|nr:T9SS type A sorting domain-containing protein [Bacteroidota bacterium]